MSSVPRTLITIATLNEIENLPALIEEVFSVAPTADILIIDDNSPDGTGQWADQKAASDSRVKALHRPAKLGLGTAKMAGMKHAIEHGYDFVLNLDGDFSHHPRYLPALLAGMDDADVMIGSRYVPGGGTPDWPLRRRLMSWAINAYTRVLTGLPVRDCSGGFRCYRVALLKQVDFKRIQSTGYSFQEEILGRLKQLGARFGETPIIFTDRRHGHSKIRATDALSALWIIFKLGLKLRLGR
jgi:dolichol-phosphate mannosyltransferase